MIKICTQCNGAGYTEEKKYIRYFFYQMLVMLKLLENLRGL